MDGKPSTAFAHILLYTTFISWLCEHKSLSYLIHLDMGSSSSAAVDVGKLENKQTRENQVLACTRG
jgi:hypothetical protein